MNGDGAMMSANPSMMMSANAPTMAMTGKPAGKERRAVVFGRHARGRRRDDERQSVDDDERQRSDDGDERQSGGDDEGGGSPRAQGLPVEGSLPSLAGAVEWLNSPPLTAEQLKGKVVLVDFWTYSCINCLRSIPYVRAWADKYKDQGLVVIGVHAPEFAFEKNIDNVKQAVAKLKIDYPVAVDNDYAIWRAFNNEYWPADYFIDAKGQIRHHYFGEGDYAESEKVIQQLLAEAGKGNLPDGHRFRQRDGRRGGLRRSRRQVARDLHRLCPGREFRLARRRGRRQAAMSMRSAISSSSTTGGCPATGRSAGSPRRSTRPTARSPFASMPAIFIWCWGRGADGKPVRFRVTIDGAAPGESHGADVERRRRRRGDRASALPARPSERADHGPHIHDPVS